MKRLLLVAAAVLALSGAAAAQSFSGGVKATLDGLSTQFTVEAAAYSIGDIRVAPIMTITASLVDWYDVQASALGGMALTWLPPDSPWAVQVQAHYRVVWATVGARAGPELLIGIVGELW